MKIEDARTKWCPFARVATRFDDGVAGAACNRGHPHDMDASINCIADKCMLWIRYSPLQGGGGQCGMMLHGSVIDANTW